MTLPTKGDYIAQLRPDECPICYEDITSPHTTECRHTFCLECLKIWVQTSHTCPTCRRELYQAPPEEEYDNEDVESNIDEDNALGDDSEPEDGDAGLQNQEQDADNEGAEQIDYRDTEWILHRFYCDREQVAKHMQTMHQQGIATADRLDDDLVWVDFRDLADRALASILFVQPHLPSWLGRNVRYAGWQSEICRQEWEIIALELRASLGCLDGKVMKASTLEAQLKSDIVPHILSNNDLSDEGIDWPDYGMRTKDGNQGWTLEDHVNQLFCYIARHAHDLYTSRVQSEPEDLHFESCLDQFYMSLSSDGPLDFQFYIVDTLKAWRKMVSNEWKLPDLGEKLSFSVPDRVEYFPLFGVAVAAMWKVKPENGLNERTMDDYCHHEWVVILQALHEKLLDLQHQVMTGYALWNLLGDHCTRRLRESDFLPQPHYSYPYSGESFATHVRMVIDQIVNEAMEGQT